MQEEKQLNNKKEDIFGYSIAMNLARQMQNKGIIYADEFIKIEQAMCDKYCINFSSIYRQNAG